MAAIHETNLLSGAPSGIVRRVLSGEAIEQISAETGIPIADLRTWVAVLVEANAKVLDRHAHPVWKHARPPLLDAVVEGDPDSSRLPVAEHQHQLWITLGLADED